MTTISVNGAQIYVERRGSGRPLVLIQGMSANSVHWGDALLTDLSRDHELILLDNRGIGRSEALQDAFTIKDMASDTIAVLDALELERPDVFGISMGGMIAQELTLAHPDRVGALTIGCSYCGGEGSQHASPEDLMMLGEAMQSGDAARALQAMWEINVSAAYAADEQAHERFLEMAAKFPAPLPVIMLQMQAIMGHDTRDRLPQITAPTLVIHGVVDRLLPVVNGKLIASQIPGSTLELFEDVGHVFFWERPAQTAELVRAHNAAVAAAAV